MENENTKLQKVAPFPLFCKHIANFQGHLYQGTCPNDSITFVLKAFALYFPIVIPCLLERVLTYFNVYTKVEVLQSEGTGEAVFLKKQKLILLIVVGSKQFFISNAQPQCCLIHTSIIILRHILYFVQLCPDLELRIFMSYLCFSFHFQPHLHCH